MPMTMDSPSDGGEAVMREQCHVAIDGEGLVILRDLVAVGLVLVEVVFPVESAPTCYCAIERQGSAQGRNQRLFLECGLRAREGHVKQGCVCVGCVAHYRRGRGGAGEEFVGGVELGMYLDTDSELPFLKLRASASVGGRRGTSFEFATLGSIFESFAERVSIVGGCCCCRRLQGANVSSSTPEAARTFVGPGRTRGCKEAP